MLVFQKGSKLGFWKYRPIPFLSNVEKILEKLMYKRVNSFLTEKKTLFMTCSLFSDKNVVLPVSYRKYKANSWWSMYLMWYICVLWKAFVTVDHEILLFKLDYYGIQIISNTYKWLWLWDFWNYWWCSAGFIRTSSIFNIHEWPQSSNITLQSRSPWWWH